MLPAFTKVMHILPPIGLAAMLIYVYGLLNRAIKNPQTLKAVMGMLFGMAAAMAMAAPIPIAEGIIVDIRNLFIGIAAAYFGVLGGAIALVVGILMRVSVGGTGLVLGVSGMIITTVMGLLWARHIQPRVANKLHGHLVLGGMISVHLIVAVFLPAGVRTDFFVGLAPMLVVAYLIGTPFLGQMILREQALIDEKDRLLNDVARDPLTNLVNRKSAAASFARLPPLHDAELGQAMLCIDVDGFKQINDTHGHICGDNVLVIISDRLTACLRPDDIFSRISGDEFLIVLHGITSEQAQIISERCRGAIGDGRILVEGVSLSISISIGVVWTQKLSTFQTLRSRADGALYRAKATGRDRVSFETDQTDQTIITSAVA